MKKMREKAVCLAPAGSGRERDLVPPEEKARYKCSGCGALLLSGQVVRCEALYEDVVGCEECSEWVEADKLHNEVDLCPNCGQPVWESGRVLMTVGGVPLACGGCAGNGFAVDACETYTEEPADVD